MSFIKVEMFSAIISSNNLFFWDSHYTYVVTFDGVAKVPLSLFNFLPSFSFLLLRQNNFNCCNTLLTRGFLPK